MNKFSVWREGYSVTGASDHARYLGTFEAETFEMACQIAGADGANGGLPSVWGCRMFDNEVDARKAFG